VYGQRKCATKPPNKIELEESTNLMKRWIADGTNKRTERRTVIIKTYWHTIINGNNRVGNNGAISNTTIYESIAILNAAYAPRFISFSLQNIDVSDNSGWWNIYYGDEMEINMKNLLRQGDCSDLNIYSTEVSDNILGWATMPYSCSTRQFDDGVVIQYSTTPNGSAWPYNEGDTLVHEVGHWMGLYHTFEGGCGGPGDLVDDTPAVASPNSNCEITDSCPGDGLGNDQVKNFMDYSVDACMDTFSLGQFERMDAQWSTYRATEPALPTTKPTPSPTLSSPPSTFPTETMSPTGDCTSLSIKIQTDRYPGEISWNVSDISGNVILAGGVYPPSSELEVFNNYLCVDPRKCYVFTITDSYGDGICCDNGIGSYEVNFDNEQIKNGGDFYFIESSQSFGSGCPSPTTAPMTTAPTTSSRTLSPTSKPTPTPTSLPTISPTKSPTISSISPSSKPTTNPTLSPTTSPISKPTPVPTSFPTIIPRKSSTPALTSFSTISPTNSSTPFISVSPTIEPSSTPASSPSIKPMNSSISYAPSSSPGMQLRVDYVAPIYLIITAFILMYLY